MNWIQKAIKHKGALHRALGIKQGQKIPISLINERIRTLQTARKKRGLTEKELKLLRRLYLAKTLRKFQKGKGK